MLGCGEGWGECSVPNGALLLSPYAIVRPTDRFSVRMGLLIDFVIRRYTKYGFVSFLRLPLTLQLYYKDTSTY